MEDVELLQLPDVPDEDIVKKYTASPPKATDSDIELRLKRLKYGDAGNDAMEVEAKDFDKVVQSKKPQSSQIKNAVGAGKSNLEDNVVTKEDLEVDQKCRQDFNT